MGTAHILRKLTRALRTLKSQNVEPRVSPAEKRPACSAVSICHEARRGAVEGRREGATICGK